MKISLFVLFINISYVVSNNVDIFDELYLKKNTNNQASVHILPRSSRETDLEILALILKVDSNDNNKCKEQLKAYCEKLRKLNPDLKDMDIKLKEICENDETSEQKCAGIDQRIKEKCDELRENLLKIKKVGSNHCNTYERQCLFMSEACRGLITEACYRLRERCYKKRRDDVADEIALRAVNENMINWWYCESFLEKACVFLNKESDELMLLCLQSRATCQRLVLEKSQICFGIKNEIHFTLQNIDNRRCYELLEKCYYYAKVCVEAYKPDCRALENYCKNKNITYLPLDTSVNPIENDKGIVEKLRLDEFYRRTEFWGVIIGKPSGKDLKDLIILISQFFKGNNMVEKCLDALTNGCIYYKTYRRDLADLCNDRNNREKNCKLILDNTASKCQDLKKALFDKGLSSESGDSKSKFYNWENLPKSLTKEDCVQLISACFYFEPVCVNKVIEACLNAKMACYKIGLEASANELLETQLRGKINGLGLDKNKGESCQKNLIQQCKMLENSNAEVCALCIEPEKACEILKDDINFRANLLNTDLNKKRDSPKEKDCVELEKKCEDILQDSDLVKLPCNTLKRNCKHLRATKKLRESILEENNNSLDSLENCIKVLEKKCNKLLTEPISRDLFGFSCAIINESCQMMYLDTMNHCSALGNNIRKYNVFINATRDHQQEKICTYWGPYCNKFAMNCPKVLLNGENGENNGPCARLERACKPFWEKRNLENDIINMLKGNLTSKEQCNLALSDHCISWINGENITLRDLCKNMTAKNDQKAQDELCQKLIDLVKKRCNLQHSELRKKKGEAEEKNKIFEELKKQVEENIKNFNLNLSIFNLGNKKERNNTNTQEMLITDIIQFSLFWEENSTIQMTEKEAAAFKTLTRMILLYSDLKVLCKPLELECSFRNDCLPYKEICGEIDIVCDKLKSLKITLYETMISIPISTMTKMITETETTTTTFTSISTSTTTSTTTFTSISTSTTTSTTTFTSISTSTTTSTTTFTSISTSTTTTTTTFTSISTSTTTSTTTTTTTATTTTTKSVDGGKVAEQSTLIRTSDIWVTSTSLHAITMTSTFTLTSTVTSTVTLTSMQKCKPTRCTMDSSKETQKPKPTKSTTDSTKETQKPEPTKSTTDSIKETQKEEEVKPNEGMKIRISEMIKIIFFGTIIMGIL